MYRSRNVVMGAGVGGGGGGGGLKPCICTYTSSAGQWHLLEVKKKVVVVVFHYSRHESCCNDRLLYDFYPSLTAISPLSLLISYHVWLRIPKSFGSLYLVDAYVQDILFFSPEA